MGMKNRTETMFAEELARMLEEMPLAKVRVSKLCQRCGAAKPTFYYYFRDKYELVAWVFLHDYSLATGDSIGYTPEVLSEVNARIETKKAFYRACFEDRGQNDIMEYCLEFNLHMTAEAFRYANEGAEMTPEQMNAVRYHNYGVMGMFCDWLFDRGDITHREMAQFLFERTPDFMREAFARYPYPAEEILTLAGKRARQTKKADPL